MEEEEEKHLAQMEKLREKLQDVDRKTEAYLVHRRN